MTAISADHLFELFNRSKKNTENVIKTAPLGICITDPNGRFEMVNPAYCQFYGYREEELIGHHFTLVVPAAYRQQMYTMNSFKAMTPMSFAKSGKYAVKTAKHAPLLPKLRVLLAMTKNQEKSPLLLILPSANGSKSV